MDESETEAFSVKAHDALVRLGFQDFRTYAQRKLIEEVLRCESSVAGVLPTGAGKTLAILVALTEHGAGVTVAVFPLKSVYDDVLLRLQELCQRIPEFKHSWSVWKPCTSLSGSNHQAKLLLITAEQAKDKLFSAQVKENQKLVRRVIFDEAPVFFSSEFRQGLSTIPAVLRGFLSCPFVLLSATLQVTHEDKLREAFLCPGLRIVRGPTIRPEAIHRVVKLQEEQVSANEIVRSISYDKKVLTIVFVKSVEEVNFFVRALENLEETRGHVVAYHGRLRNEERKLAALLWKSGQRRVMIATTAFAYGVHDNKCRTIIHVDGAFDVDTYVQAVGRAGRDGREARSIILLSKRAQRIRNNFFTFIGASSCRLAFLSSLFDTKELQWHGSCGRCDRCIEAKFEQQEVSLDWRRKAFSVYKPTKEVLPSHERSFANRELARVRRFLRRMQQICKSSYCTSCFLVSRGTEQKEHCLPQCPFWSYRCFRCGGQCQRKSCKNHRTISKRLTQASLCVTCGMPPFLFDVNIHEGEHSMGRNCSYKDTLLPALLLAWQLQETRQALESFSGRSFHGFEDFLHWSLEQRLGLGNFVYFFFDYVG